MSELLRPDRPDAVPAYVPDPLPGAGRPKPGVPVEDSYLTNHLRLRLPFGGVADLVPDPGASGTAGPAELGLCGPVAILSLWFPPEAMATGLDQHVQRYVAAEVLGRLVGVHHPSVAFPADRSWVEVGAAVPDADVALLLSLAVERGLSAIHVWDSSGLRVEWTDGRPSTGPVPVSLRLVEAVCPMTGASRREPCSPNGTPWERIRLQGPRDFWWAHCALLAATLGCSTCDPGLSQWLQILVQPSRAGGWFPLGWLDSRTAG